MSILWLIFLASLSAVSVSDILAVLASLASDVKLTLSTSLILSRTNTGCLTFATSSELKPNLSALSAIHVLYSSAAPVL